MFSQFLKAWVLGDLLYHSLLNSCNLASVELPLHWNQGCQAPSWPLSCQIQCTSCLPSLLEDLMVWPTPSFSKPSFLLASVALPLPGLPRPFESLLIDLLRGPLFFFLPLVLLPMILSLDFFTAYSACLPEQSPIPHSFNIKLYPNLHFWPKQLLWASDPLL